MAHSGNAVMRHSILKQRIGAGAIRTLHVLKLNHRHMSAGRGLERRGIMDGSSRGPTAPVGCSRDGSEQHERRYPEPGVPGQLVVRVWIFCQWNSAHGSFAL